jgi:hypothetical protein
VGRLDRAHVGRLACLARSVRGLAGPGDGPRVTNSAYIYSVCVCVCVHARFLYQQITGSTKSCIFSSEMISRTMNTQESILAQASP